VCFGCAVVVCAWSIRPYNEEQAGAVVVLLSLPILCHALGCLDFPAAGIVSLVFCPRACLLLGAAGTGASGA